MMEYLRAWRGSRRSRAAGSLRRGRETIGDVDILVTGPNAAAVLERVAAYPRVNEVLGRGVNKTSVKVGREGLQIDVRALEHESFGAAMQYFTGSKEHNVALRQRALRMGLTLNDGGVEIACDVSPPRPEAHSPAIADLPGELFRKVDTYADEHRNRSRTASPARD